jgi:hypothetical protein
VESPFVREDGRRSWHERAYRPRKLVNWINLGWPSKHAAHSSTDRCCLRRRCCSAATTEIADQFGDSFIRGRGVNVHIHPAQLLDQRTIVDGKLSTNTRAYVTSEVVCYARLHSRNYSSGYASRLFWIVRVTLCAPAKRASKRRLSSVRTRPSKQCNFALRKPVSLKLNTLLILPK